VVGPVKEEDLARELSSIRASTPPRAAASQPSRERDVSPTEQVRIKGHVVEFPSSYGVTRCRIMARDPYWVHAYWEIGEESLEKARLDLDDQWEGHKRILRVHSVPAENGRAEDTQPAGFFDIEVGDEATSWYIHVGIPNRAYRVDVGLLARTGLFYPLASSNRVVSPPDRMSEQVDETWSSSDETAKQLYELSGGPPFQVRPSAPRGTGQGPAGTEMPPAHPGPPRPAGPATGAGEIGDGSAQTAGARPAGEGTSRGRDESAGGTLEDRGFAAGRREDAGPVDAASEAGRAGQPPAAGRRAPAGPGAPIASAGGVESVDAAGEAGSVETAGHIRGRRDLEWPSSPQVWAGRPTSPGPWPSSAERPAREGPEKGFWFVLNTELIVSGATEPDANVTVQGVPVKLRPDGTFTVRFQLPDGEQIIPCVATSADGAFERGITPQVRRETTGYRKDEDDEAEEEPER
jgi:hypothetical protein